jgi:hypothetical protein
MSFRIWIELSSDVLTLPTEQLLDPIKIALCGCSGIDPDSMRSIISSGLEYEIFSEHDIDRTISIIRSEVTTPDSVLNSLTRTRLVFSEAKFEIYLKTSSKSPDIVFRAPENIAYDEDEPLPMTMKLSLPPNSTHNPIRVIFVNSGSDETELRDSDLDRSLLIQVPAQLMESDDHQSSSLSAVISDIESHLAKPIPVLPDSFLALKSLIAN